MLMSLKVRIGQTSLLIFWGSQSASTKGRCLLNKANWPELNSRSKASARRSCVMALLSSELRASGRCDVGTGVGVPVDAPAALGRLGEKHPGALGQCRVAGGGGNNLGELSDHAQLLVAVKDAGRGEDLHPYVVAIAGDVGQRVGGQVVEEGRRVLLEQRERRDLLPAHHCGGEILGQRVLVVEGSGGGVDVDHWHWVHSSLGVTLVVGLGPPIGRGRGARDAK